MILFRTLALCAAALTALSSQATAQGTGDLVQMEILPGWITDTGTRMVGLRLRLAPGWKTYWRSPGDAGIPPLFDWTGSENITGAQLHWPAPVVFDQAGMQSIGYEGEVVIPIELAADRPGAAQRMAGSVEIGICHDICIPVQLPFDLTLPPDGRRDPGIVAALIDQPVQADAAGVRGVACTAAPGDAGLTLTARLTLPPVGTAEVVVIEAGDPAIWVSQARTHRDGGDLVATVTMTRGDGGALALDRQALRFTVLGDGIAVDVLGCTAG